MRCNLHNVLAYEQPKTVIIRDFRLGLTYYMMCALIIAYVVVEIFYYNVWLDFLPPRFIVNLNLKEQMRGEDCNPLLNSCLTAYPAMESLRYCCQKTCDDVDDAEGKEGKCACPGLTTWSYKCIYYDPPAFTKEMDYSLFVTTMRTTYSQTQNKSCLTYTERCERLWLLDDSPRSRYVAGVESFSVEIDHSVFQERLGLYEASRDMKGFLEVASGTAMQRQLCASWTGAVDKPHNGKETNDSPCYLRLSVTRDKRESIKLGTLLAAMGVDLDMGYNNSDAESIRSKGLAVSLSIEYFNSMPWLGLLSRVNYVYRLTPNRQPTIRNTITNLGYHHQRRLLREHGLSINVFGGGALAGRNLTNCLSACLTVFALFVLADYVMRKIVVWLLFMRRMYYEDYMYEITADFSYVRELERLSSVQLRDALRRRGLPDDGSRKESMFRLLSSGWRPHENVSLISEIELGEMSSRQGGDAESPESEEELLDEREIQKRQKLDAANRRVKKLEAKFRKRQAEADGSSNFTRRRGKKNRGVWSDSDSDDERAPSEWRGFF